MEKGRELARLNLVLELVSECASLTSLDELERVVAGRLRWIIDFDRCELMLLRDGAMRMSTMAPGDDALAPSAMNATPPEHASLIDAAIATGAPAAAGKPISVIAYPLGSDEKRLGVLCLSAGIGGFSHRDLRLLHHICSSLSAVLSRLRQERVVETQRVDALEREQQGRSERAARDEALAENQAKDAFLAMLGHELRNPLAPIIASALLLRGEVSGASSERVEIIERQARHLDRLVSDLLDVSRITTGKVNLRRSRIDLCAVAMKAAEMVRPTMDAKGQRLTLTLPAEGVAVVDGDETRLAQVLTNLLGNASNYSSAKSRVELRVELADGGVLASVIDEGIGMSLKTLATVFDMFVQGGRSHEWAPGGLGLGLGVSRALVQMHDGRIVAESAGEGLGSRVTVWLPCATGSAPVAEAAPVSAPAASSSTTSVRLLLVDDNRDAADSMGELCRVMGHDVRVVYSPEQALAEAPAFAPEVAVLDIGLPMMSGHELGTRLRTLLPTPLKLIALSGFGQETDRQKSIAHGFAAHLVKPADLSSLADAINGSSSVR